MTLAPWRRLAGLVRFGDASGALPSEVGAVDVALRPSGATDAELTPQQLEGLRFRLDVEIDIEHERLLLYRIVLVLELVAGALFVRHLLLTWLQG